LKNQNIYMFYINRGPAPLGGLIPFPIPRPRALAALHARGVDASRESQQGHESQGPGWNADGDVASEGGFIGSLHSAGDGGRDLTAALVPGAGRQALKVCPFPPGQWRGEIAP